MKNNHNQNRGYNSCNFKKLAVEAFEKFEDEIAKMYEFKKHPKPKYPNLPE